MKNILLPTDFSKNSLNAMYYAMALFKDIPCKFYLLNVFKIPYLANEELMENDIKQLALIEKGVDISEIYQKKDYRNATLKRGENKNENIITNLNF